MIGYLGSKKKVLPRIEKMIDGLVVESVLDGFSGSTIVSQYFANRGSKTKVHCNDLAVWSNILGNCYLNAKIDKKECQEILDYLNNLDPIDGWFTENYGGDWNNGISIQEDGKKKPFLYKNSQKLDSIRHEIDNLDLDYTDWCVVLTSLLEAVDKVSNKTTNYVYYQKNWTPNSQKDLILKVPDYKIHNLEHEVTQDDVFDLLDRHYDLCYYDPPYGTNSKSAPASRVRYYSYYHLFVTIILNDRPNLFGKSARREDSKDKFAVTIFEEYKDDSANRAMERLIEETNANYILISYGSDGIIPYDEIMSIAEKRGKVTSLSFDHKLVSMAYTSTINETVQKIHEGKQEYLFLIETS